MSTYDARKRAWTKYNKSKKKRIAQKKYYESHAEKCKDLSVAWQKKNRDHVNGLVRLRNATPEGRAIRRASFQRYCRNNRIKRLAKDAVHNALRAGKIKRLSCSICGNEKSEGHHPDYSKPLEVKWLCKKHHSEIHK